MRMDFSDSINANSEFVRVRPKGPDYWILEPGDIVEVVSTETNKPLAIAMYTEADNVADPYDMYGRNDWLRWIFATDKAKINRAWRRIRKHENNPCDCNLIGQMLPFPDTTANRPRQPIAQERHPRNARKMVEPPDRHGRKDHQQLKTPQEIADQATKTYDQYLDLNHGHSTIEINLQYTQTLALANIAKNLETITESLNHEN